jgi:hypothetical protein
MMHSKQASLKQTGATAIQLVIAIAALVLTANVAQAQQTASPARTAPAAVTKTVVPAPAQQVAEEEESSAKPSKPGSEGIKVHGHWVLQVKNADGTLGERREFENSLVTTNDGTNTTSGSGMLAAALTGNAAVSDPGIGFVQGTLTGDQSTWCSYFGNVAPSGITCYGFTTTNSLWNLTAQNIPAGLVYDSLGLGISATFTPTVSIVLTGNFTVPGGLTQISAVQTLWGECVPESVSYVNPGGAVILGSGTVRNADITSKNCTNAGVLAAAGAAVPIVEVPITFALTSTAVTSGGTPAPLSVTTGQVITVTVTISFS